MGKTFLEVQDQEFVDVADICFFKVDQKSDSESEMHFVYINFYYKDETQKIKKSHNYVLMGYKDTEESIGYQSYDDVQRSIYLKRVLNEIFINKKDEINFIDRFDMTWITSQAEEFVYENCGLTRMPECMFTNLGSDED